MLRKKFFGVSLYFPDNTKSWKSYTNFPDLKKMGKGLIDFSFFSFPYFFY